MERWTSWSVRWSISGNLFPKYNPRIKDIIRKGNIFIYLYYLSPKRIIEVTEARVVITTTK